MKRGVQESQQTTKHEVREPEEPSRTCAAPFLGRCLERIEVKASVEASAHGGPKVPPWL